MAKRQREPAKPVIATSEIYDKYDGKAGRRPSTALFEDGTYDWDEFRKVFFQERDIYEYRAAIKLVGTWHEWERLKAGSPTFRKTVAAWVGELKVKLRSDAFSSIVAMTDQNNAAAITAAKWLIDEVTERPNATKAGRPSKQAVAQEAKRIAQESKEEKEELKRIREAALSQREDS